jgi:putative SOS response-associated peptidase YedK
MCGRFSLVVPKEIFQLFGVPVPSGFKPRYNIAPGQDCYVIVPDASAYRLRTMRWGLIPSWADDPAIGFKTINARAETLAEKPAYRESFRKKRCLIPADGFYEWRPIAGVKSKLPMRFTLSDEQPFCFAGLWSLWKPRDAEPVETFTLVTTAADGVFSPVHDREPVILGPGPARKWADPKAGSEELLSLLKAYPSAGLKGYEVSKAVNSAVRDVPECIVPAGDIRWP